MDDGLALSYDSPFLSPLRITFHKVYSALQSWFIYDMTARNFSVWALSVLKHNHFRAFQSHILYMERPVTATLPPLDCFRMVSWSPTKSDLSISSWCGSGAVWAVSKQGGAYVPTAASSKPRKRQCAAFPAKLERYKPVAAWPASGNRNSHITMKTMSEIHELRNSAPHWISFRWQAKGCKESWVAWSRHHGTALDMHRQL